MNTILLQPTDVLFFRDGRPMTGSHAGHTAAWPLPDITNHALHAALHRAGFIEVHSHRRGRSGYYSSDPNHRDRKFGALITVGPFPVREKSDNQLAWFFPRPKDATQAGTMVITLVPASNLKSDSGDRWTGSSLPKPLKYAVVNTQPPTKEALAEPWINAAAFAEYLGNTHSDERPEFIRDNDIADQEAYIGIAIDPDTQTTGRGAAAGKIYSAHYLRLRENWRLGLFAECLDKSEANSIGKRDLIANLFQDKPQSIIVGGQQRICTAERKDTSVLPLPHGLSRTADFKKLNCGKFAVKWVLLTPAIWPEIAEGISRRGTKRRFHPGGWLPNWICPETGQVLLEAVSSEERRRRRSLNYEGRGYESRPNIAARLAAAIVPKPIPVTGWALPNDSDRPQGGAKSTHLAVPAGAVYYFEADSAKEAARLASVLNWHGEPSAHQVKNRRSTLLGEKGYGLGVCGTWQHQTALTSDDVPEVAADQKIN